MYCSGLFGCRGQKRTQICLSRKGRTYQPCNQTPERDVTALIRSPGWMRSEGSIVSSPIVWWPPYLRFFFSSGLLMAMATSSLQISPKTRIKWSFAWIWKIWKSLRKSCWSSQPHLRDQEELFKILWQPWRVWWGVMQGDCRHRPRPRATQAGSCCGETRRTDAGPPNSS